MDGSPHLSYCGGSFGRVSLMAAHAELADHARDCVQLLVNVHPDKLAVRVDGTTSVLETFDALLIAARQTYAIPRQVQAPPTGRPGLVLVKVPVAPAAGCGELRARGAGAPAALRTLSRAARQDVQQLVAALLRETPESGTIEAGVRALVNETGPWWDAAAARSPHAGLEAYIAREVEGSGLASLEQLASARQRADVYGVSARHFQTLFRRATQLAPRAYYNMRRLDEAFALLSDASRSITDIGYELGFSAPPHFTRFMRSNTGWTPSAFRARVQGLPPPLRPRLACAPAA